jgi:hypothetical protein
MHIPLAALVLAASALSPAGVLAQAQPQPVKLDPTAYRHDRGLMLRLDLGVGYLNASLDTSPTLTVKGAGPELGVVVGGPVSENFILGGHLWVVGSISPTIQQGSVEVGTNDDTSSTLVGIGLNLTYYLMPANVYLSATPSLTRLGLTWNGVSGSSEAGFGMHLALGKEWWVSEHWGLGLAGQFMFSSNDDRNGGPHISSLAGALALSATFN